MPVTKGLNILYCPMSTHKIIDMYVIESNNERFVIKQLNQLARSEMRLASCNSYGIHS